MAARRRGEVTGRICATEQGRERGAAGEWQRLGNL
jgi:hypothetical protein